MLNRKSEHDAEKEELDRKAREIEERRQENERRLIRLTSRLRQQEQGRLAP